RDRRRGEDVEVVELDRRADEGGEDDPAAGDRRVVLGLGCADTPGAGWGSVAVGSVAAVSACGRVYDDDVVVALSRSPTRFRHISGPPQGRRRPARIAGAVSPVVAGDACGPGGADASAERASP